MLIHPDRGLFLSSIKLAMSGNSIEHVFRVNVEVEVFYVTSCETFELETNMHHILHNQ